MCRILILADIDLWRISFHAVVVFGLGKNLLFKSILGRCEADQKNNNFPGLKIIINFH